jgi:8-oxo-dGTP pyrophosphatase MutT (NUDIX family)
MSLPTVAFSLLIIEHPETQPSGKRKFALVHEKSDRGWWLPAGAVDDGETFVQGGCREAAEEAGVTEFQGPLRLIRVEQTIGRMRWVLYGRAARDTLKQVPDKESQGAAWMTAEETLKIARGEFNVLNCHLRGTEPLEFFSYLDESPDPSSAPTTYPLDVVDAVSVAGALHFGKRDVYVTDREVRLAVRKGESFMCLDGRLPRTTALTPAGSMASVARALFEAHGIPVTAAIKGILGFVMHQRGDSSATFAAVYLVDGGALAANMAPVGDFSDQFERACMERALNGDVMPLRVLAQSESEPVE